MFEKWAHIDFRGLKVSNSNFIWKLERLNVFKDTMCLTFVFSDVYAQGALSKYAVLYGFKIALLKYWCLKMKEKPGF